MTWTWHYFVVVVVRVDMTVYPELSRVPWFRAMVQEGDCLYLPYLWLHNVSAESAVCSWLLNSWPRCICLGQLLWPQHGNQYLVAAVRVSWKITRNIQY